MALCRLLSTHDIWFPRSISFRSLFSRFICRYSPTVQFAWQKQNKLQTEEEVKTKSEKSPHNAVVLMYFANVISHSVSEQSLRDSLAISVIKQPAEIRKNEMLYTQYYRVCECVFECYNYLNESQNAKANVAVIYHSHFALVWFRCARFLFYSINERVRISSPKYEFVAVFLLLGACFFLFRFFSCNTQFFFFHYYFIRKITLQVNFHFALMEVYSIIKKVLKFQSTVTRWQSCHLQCDKMKTKRRNYAHEHTHTHKRT